MISSGAEVTDCGKYLIVSPVKDCRDNLLFFAELSDKNEITGKLPLTQIVHKFEADYEVRPKINLTNLRIEYNSIWQSGVVVPDS